MRNWQQNGFRSSFYKLVGNKKGFGVPAANVARSFTRLEGVLGTKMMLKSLN